LCTFTKTLEKTIKLVEHDEMISEVYGIYGTDGERFAFTVIWEENVIDELQHIVI